MIIDRERLSGLGDPLNAALYLYRRSRVANDLRRWFWNLEDVEVREPIFLIGNQGGGLTLLARILRRNPRLVSISGGPDYWSGADEMQSAARRLLPTSLTQGGRVFGDAPSHAYLSPPRGWSYACDDLFPAYRKTSSDADEEARAKLLTVIRTAIRKFSTDEEEPRFIDKSQHYTIKVPFLRELLADESPCFILLVRNPYVSCPRAAFVKAGDMLRYSGAVSDERLLEICCEHWRNAIGTAMEDIQGVEGSGWFRFEDLLERPKTVVGRICEVVGLEFDASMLPSEDDRMPAGSRYGDRWYPIRTDVNQKYHEMLRDEPWMARMVEDMCGELADEIGYPNPLSGARE